MGRLYKAITCIMLLLIISLSLSCCSAETSAENSVSYNLGDEPESIDPGLCSSVEGANVVLACFEGLMRLDKDCKAIPGVAASYTKESDTKYIFKLRECKWWDGKPVSARDFEYAWKRVLSPETGCENAYQLYCIKGGETYNKAQSGAEGVCVKAVDDRTLEVELEAPVVYFLELLASPVYMPVRQDIVAENPEIWCCNPSTYVGNGPFKLSLWIKHECMEFERNDEYYDTDRVKLSGLIFKMIYDDEACLAAFESGDVDMIESPPVSEASRLHEQNLLVESPYPAVYFYSFNTSRKPLDDSRVRRALSYAINRDDIIQSIIKEGALPASAIVPGGIPDASDISSDFRSIGGPYIECEGEQEEARILLSEAGYPGGRDFPKLTLLYDISGFHKAIAQAVSDMWKENLGIIVELKPLSWDTLQKSKFSGDFDIVRHGWYADYIDPIAFLELFASNSGNNCTKYTNAAYDQLISAAKYEGDQVKRSRIMHQAEDMLMDDMPVLPIFFYTDVSCCSRDVKGVVRLPMGYTYFDQAYLDKAK